MDTEYRTYLFSYYHEGSCWAFEIKARDADDAHARLTRLPYASFDGELIMSVPVPSGILQRIARIFALNRG